jgi:hypothetical protein
LDRLLGWLFIVPSSEWEPGEQLHIGCKTDLPEERRSLLLLSKHVAAPTTYCNSREPWSVSPGTAAAVAWRPA